MKTLLRDRIRISQLFGVVVFCYYVFGVTIWNSKNIIVENALFVLGTIFIAVGVIGRVWCLSYIAGNKDNILVTNGPYSLCRNPLYLFSFIAASGVGLGTETFTIPFIIFLGFIIYYPFTILREETALRLKFGSEYENYLQTVTTRIIPISRYFSECERIEINPTAFRRGISDLLFFIIFLGIFEFIEMLHVSEMLPSFYHIF